MCSLVDNVYNFSNDFHVVQVCYCTLCSLFLSLLFVARAELYYCCNLMKRTLRNAVSGTRNRYKEGQYDLDLTYITPRLIAMGYPSHGRILHWCGITGTYHVLT